MGTNLQILLALAGLAALFWFLWPRPAFVIAIRGGVPQTKRGRVTARFLEDCGSLCRERRIERGSIRGVHAAPNHISLRFSRSIAREHHQTFRNCWEQHR